MMCFPSGATSGSNTVGMNIVTTFCGSPNGRFQSRMHKCEGSKSGKPVASIPKNKCMMDPSAGISDISSFHSTERSNCCAFKTSASGNIGTVSQIVALDTTAFLAFITFPFFNRTPFASPSWTIISSTCDFNCSSPPNFSKQYVNLSTTACVPPSGAHNDAPGR